MSSLPSPFFIAGLWFPLWLTMKIKKKNETLTFSASGQFSGGNKSCQCSTPRTFTEPSLSHLWGLKLGWSSKINHSSLNALLVHRMQREEQNTDVTDVFHSAAGVTGVSKCLVHPDPSWDCAFTSVSWFFQVSETMPVFPSLIIPSFPHTLTEKLLSENNQGSVWSYQ